MNKDTSRFVIGKATVKMEAGDGIVFEFECSDFVIEDQSDVYRLSSGFPQIEDQEVIINRKFHFEGSSHEINIISGNGNDSLPQNINSFGMLKRICKKED